MEATLAFRTVTASTINEGQARNYGQPTEPWPNQSASMI